MIIIGWSTSRMASQRWSVVSIFAMLKRGNVRTETCQSNSFPVNTSSRLMVVIKSVGHYRAKERAQSYY